MIPNGGIRSKTIPTFKAHTLDSACAVVLHMAQLCACSDAELEKSKKVMEA